MINSCKGKKNWADPESAQSYFNLYILTRVVSRCLCFFAFLKTPKHSPIIILYSKSILISIPSLNSLRGSSLKIVSSVVA